VSRISAISMTFLLIACTGSPFTNAPPADRFYFPTGLVHVNVPGSTDGVLFVASSNFDKRYATGSLTAVNLDLVARGDGGVGLPPFGAAPLNGPVPYPSLGTTSQIFVNTFASEVAMLPMAPGRARLFVPSRSEGMKFQAVDTVIDGGTIALSCFPAANSDKPLDCGANAPSTSPNFLEQSAAGVPRAPIPFGVSVAVRSCSADADCYTDAGPNDGRACSNSVCKSGGDPFADVYVTSLQQADSPLGSGLNLSGYMVRAASDRMTIDQTNFVTLSTGASNSAASGKRWTYVTGRFVAPYPALLRLVDVNNNVLLPGLEQYFGVIDTRGIAIGSNEARLFVVGRSPDVLMVIRVDNPTADLPGLQIVRAVPLPNAPQQVRVIPRPGRGDLVAVTSSGSGVVSIYDEDVGNLVAQVTNVGLQPFGLAVDLRGVGARLYASDFNDGRVAVIDIPNLGLPQDARLVAHLGVEQLCLTRPTQTAGCTNTIGVLP
jgi:hypothetical protein